MLKHVQISPMRNRADTVSLRSSISCSSSLCGSPEPLSDLHSMRTPSRASSYSSLNDAMSPQTTIKIFTSCLRIDIEYKTLGIQWETTSREVVRQVLRRCKMRHRDPRLFYLSMEVTIRKAGVKTLLKLEGEARPALLQACHPKGDSRFCLQMKPGGLIRVHTSALQPTSQYKSLVISEETTSDELLGLLLSTYNSLEAIEQFSLYEVCPGQEYQRKLHPDDLPLRALQQRTQKAETCHFLVRRNPNYPRRRLLLPPITETNATTVAALQLAPTPTTPSDSPSAMLAHEEEDVDRAATAADAAQDGCYRLVDKCNKCRNSFKSCDFCNCKINNNSSSISNNNNNNSSINNNNSVSIKNEPTGPLATTPLQRPPVVQPRKFIINDRMVEPLSYSPVYNIREIRTVCHSFSSLGIDKKLLDIHHVNQRRPTSMVVVGQKQKKQLQSPNVNKLINNNYSNHSGSSSSSSNSNNVGGEEENTNPAKGVAKFVYI